ncbi:43976_t:CDS:2, partial [Gigaspora margarita]
SNKEITEKEQYFFNTIETEEDETKKLKQNILLATECGTRDYGIKELENQIENSKYEEVQDISNQPNALSQELLNLDNYNQESKIDESRSKNATKNISTRNHNGEVKSYRKLNKQKGLESPGKENRPVFSYSYKNNNNGNFSSEGIYYQELAGSSQQVSWPSSKKDALLEWAEQKDINIIGITETNIT